MSAGDDFPSVCAAKRRPRGDAPQNDPEKFAVNEQKGDRLRKISLKRMTRRGAQKGIRAHGQRSRNRPRRTTAAQPMLATADRNKRPQRVRRLRPPIAANGRSERSRQNKKDPPVPQNEKVLTRSRRWVRRCGASDFPLKKQTLPIAADHFTGAPVVQLWIKIIRTPNTADLK